MIIRQYKYMVSTVILATTFTMGGMADQYSLDSLDQSIEAKYHAARTIVRGTVAQIDKPSDANFDYRIVVRVLESLKGPSEIEISVYTKAEMIRHCFPALIINGDNARENMHKLLGHELKIICSHGPSADTYSLFQCLDINGWRAIAAYSTVVSRRDCEAQQAQAEVHDLLHEYHEGNISREQSVARRQDIEKRYPWLKDQLDESRRQSEQASAVLKAYVDIMKDHEAGLLDETTMVIKINDLYRKNIEFGTWIKRLAANDGVDIWGSDNGQQRRPRYEGQ